MKQAEFYHNSWRKMIQLWFFVLKYFLIHVEYEANKISILS